MSDERLSMFDERRPEVDDRSDGDGWVAFRVSSPNLCETSPVPSPKIRNNRNAGR